MIYKIIREGFLGRSVMLPRGFFDPRGNIGEFSHCVCLVALMVKQQTLFYFQRIKAKSKKTPFKTHCLRGLYVENFKNTIFCNIEKHGDLIQNRTSSPTFKRVIGNKYDKNTLKSASSLVTKGQKTGGKVCRHW